MQHLDLSALMQKHLESMIRFSMAVIGSVNMQTFRLSIANPLVGPFTTTREMAFVGDVILIV